jgi:HlyD family secretion protein
MPRVEKSLFREKALRHLSSPGDLERLMPVAGGKDWLLIVACAGLTVLFCGWCLTGRIPTVVAGKGVILRPRRVMQTQTTAAGRIVSLEVRQGDQVRAGDRIAAIDQSELHRRVEADTGVLRTLEEQDRTKSAAERVQLALQQQQDALDRAALEGQRNALQHTLSDALRLQPVLETRAQADRTLVKEGLMARATSELAEAETAIRDNGAKIDDSRARLGQIDGQLKQIETRAAALERLLLEQATARGNEIAQLRKSLAINQLLAERDGVVRSQYSGRVAEVMSSEGQVLPAGGRLLTIEADDALESLTSISYFSVRDGKRIQPGMRIQVTPDTVARERFGGIVGTVVWVSPTPVTKEGVLSTLGNPDVVQALIPEGAWIEVRAVLEKDPFTFSGYRWSSSRGPQMRISEGLTNAARVTVERRAPVTYLVPALREFSGAY